MGTHVNGSRVILAFATILAAGCSKKAAPTTTWQADSAREIFQTDCANCHGVSGTGDGSAGLLLDPRPRNYTDRKWQAKITDEQIARTVLLGGAAVGKSKAMPAHPKLKDKPEVLAELVKIVRAFGN